jgi:putative mRNA 3-end processing factor
MVLEFTEAGIYCPAADIHIDPWRPVPRALITHGHSDHARPGHGAYLATTGAAPVIRHRLGDIRLQTIDYGETRTIGGATSASIPPATSPARRRSGSRSAARSGSSRATTRPWTTAFPPVRAGPLPHLHHRKHLRPADLHLDAAGRSLPRELNAWWSETAATGRHAVLGVYALGKAQRILRLLDPSIGPILTHGAVEATTDVLRAQGLALPDTIQITPETDLKSLKGAMVLAPPSALGSAWMRRLGPCPPASPRAGCACAVSAAAVPRTGASSSPTMPTGTGSTPPSPPPGQAASTSPTATPPSSPAGSRTGLRGRRRRNGIRRRKPRRRGPPDRGGTRMTDLTAIDRFWRGMARGIDRPVLRLVASQRALRFFFEISARTGSALPRGATVIRDRHDGLTITPRGVAGDAPLIFYIHGGGFTIGSPRTYAALAGHLAAACRDARLPAPLPARARTPLPRRARRRHRPLHGHRRNCHARGPLRRQRGRLPRPATGASHPRHRPPRPKGARPDRAHRRPLGRSGQRFAEAGTRC